MHLQVLKIFLPSLVNFGSGSLSSGTDMSQYGVEKATETITKVSQKSPLATLKVRVE